MTVSGISSKIVCSDSCEINRIVLTKPLYLQEDAILIFANANDLADNVILRVSPGGKFEDLFWYLFVFRTVAVRKQTRTVDLFECVAIQLLHIVDKIAVDLEDAPRTYPFEVELVSFVLHMLNK